MESEKVKEIKKALEDNANYEHHDKLGYIDGYKCKTVAFVDILTLINELESENEKLQEVNGALSCDLDYVNEKLTNAEIEIDDYKDRIAELEKENESIKKQLIAIDTLDETNFEKRHNAMVSITEKQLKQFGKKFEFNIGKYLKKKYSDYQQDSFYYIVDKSDVDMCLDETLKEFINTNKGDEER